MHRVKHKEETKPHCSASLVRDTDLFCLIILEVPFFLDVSEFLFESLRKLVVLITSSSQGFHT